MAPLPLPFVSPLIRASGGAPPSGARAGPRTHLVGELGSCDRVGAENLEKGAHLRGPSAFPLSRRRSSRSRRASGGLLGHGLVPLGPLEHVLEVGARNLDI